MYSIAKSIVFTSKLRVTPLANVYTLLGFVFSIVSSMLAAKYRSRDGSVSL